MFCLGMLASVSFTDEEVESMDYRKVATTTNESEANTQRSAGNRHGFIIATILSAFEGYGAALCGHVATDPAADGATNVEKAISVSPAPRAACTETLDIRNVGWWTLLRSIP